MYDTIFFLKKKDRSNELNIRCLTIHFSFLFEQLEKIDYYIQGKVAYLYVNGIFILVQFLYSIDFFFLMV